MKAPSNRREFMKSIASACAGLAVFAMLGCSPGMAATGEPTEQEKAWDKLSDSEKAAVEKKWEEYKKLPATEQEDLKKGLARYNALTEEQKASVNKAYEKWKGLSEEQKKEITAKFAQWKELSAEEKQAVREEVKKAVGAATAK